MSNIQWTDKTWNPTGGCTRVSPGCENCYAERQAVRFSGPGKRYEGLTRSTSRGPVWTGKVKLFEDRLEEPLHWRKPRRVFVDSMSDLFHPDVPDEYIISVLGIAALAPQHTFQILTKRPEYMHDVLSSFADVADAAVKLCVGNALNRIGARPVCRVDWDTWPLPNVWLGTSVENQDAADERIPHLLRTPAAVRFLSVEPLLSDVWLTPYLNPCASHEPVPSGLRWPSENRIHWVIVGGESGPGARPCRVEWIRSIVEQCGAAGVSCFVKQLGTRSDAEQPDIYPTGDRKRGYPRFWPEDLRVREYPA